MDNQDKQAMGLKILAALEKLLPVMKDGSLVSKVAVGDRLHSLQLEQQSVTFDLPGGQSVLLSLWLKQ